ncbi:phage baseplate assembly protein V [Tenacibaculum maritimum]|uniref:type VI secretion system Vgr family protein n=1 Tax=Tenacibaculum maritimum TaxID=107401 RepID=UPI0038772741
MRGMIAPKTTFAIPYQCQYNESDFAYLKRLANQYNEWFYYEGEYLVFGKPKEEKSPIHLEYNQEVYEIKIATKTAAVSQRAYDFSYEGNNMLTASSKNDKVTSTLSEYALNAAMKLYPKESLGMPETVLADQYEVDRYLLGKTESVLSEFDVLEAKSKYVGLEIGSVIRFSSGEKYIGGNYLITEITHTQAQDKEYENHFKAISSTSRYLPAPKVTPLMAGTQRAMVIDHADPLHKGRVKVKMLWQENEMATNWIQVLAPDAGSSAVVGTNRGYVFIPEIGDQVLIGFHHNDPNRPFVLGNLHHADSAGGGQVNNNIKSIKTRSGHTIAFNDTERAESISITDRNKNKVFIDTAKNNIEITANETMTLNCKNMSINVAESMNTVVGGNIIENAGKNITTSAGRNINQAAGADFVKKSINMSEEIDENMNVLAKLSQDVVGKLEIASTVENLNFNSAKGINSNTKEQSNFQ